VFSVTGFNVVSCHRPSIIDYLVRLVTVTPSAHWVLCNYKVDIIGSDTGVIKVLQGGVVTQSVLG